MRKPEMPMPTGTTPSPSLQSQYDTFQQRGWPSAANRFRYRDDNPTPYEGFCIDLLKEMAKLLNFTYEVVEVDDGAYGVEVCKQQGIYLNFYLAFLNKNITFMAIIKRAFGIFIFAKRAKSQLITYYHTFFYKSYILACVYLVRTGEWRNDPEILMCLYPLAIKLDKAKEAIAIFSINFLSIIFGSFSANGRIDT